MTAVPVITVKTVVDRIADGGAGIKLFTLVDPDRWELPPFKPGAHIDLHLANGMIRTYSLCNDPADNARYIFAVKREANGRGGSVHLHDEVREGDAIGVSLPRGGLQLAPHLSRFVFVAGGIGVTPFLSAAAQLRRTGRDAFTLHMITRGPPPLADLLALMIDSGHAVVHDTAVTGRPDIAALVGLAATDTGIGCCGPETMISDFEQAACGWSAEHVHVERFVAPPLPVDPQARPYTLVLARSGRDIAVGAGESMLQALTTLGVDVPTSCCGGICGACRVGWLEGEPVHRDRALSPAERTRSLLVCVAGSASERLVLDL
ncbi:oxidoreductase [Rhodopseudomonas boonkerdii]|uniref:PDR/VanB family oxidoreductase n=1 Tax=Rhodopseudomonas boonkerdii TaxID=475937 RepID=UPI001E3DF88A|nr:PDR/VanB family oxidoreductase [Rhodopseudomonas boonkerdii]UGV27318.1 oxidoreductase [Rhodopseudomonas boonkerdii]